jgi:hypothetical protein
MKKIIIVFAILNFNCNQKNTTSESSTTSSDTTSESIINSPDGTSESNISASTIDSKIKEYINSNADDPSSYQPQETTVLDTVYKVKTNGEINNVPKSQIAYVKNQIRPIKEALEYDLNRADPDLFAEAIKSKKEKILKFQEEIDLIKIAIKDKANISGYVFGHKYRIKNNHGALILKEAFVVTNPELKIEYFGENYFQCLAVLSKWK